MQQRMGAAVGQASVGSRFGVIDAGAFGSEDRARSRVQGEDTRLRRGRATALITLPRPVGSGPGHWPNKRQHRVHSLAIAVHGTNTRQLLVVAHCPRRWGCRLGVGACVSVSSVRGSGDMPTNAWGLKRAKPAMPRGSLQRPLTFSDFQRYQWFPVGNRVRRGVCGCGGVGRVRMCFGLSCSDCRTSWPLTGICTE